MHFTKNCTRLQLSFKEFNRRCRTTLLKYASRWLLLRTSIIFENIQALNMEKHELRVESYELSVTGWKLKSMSWTSKMRVEILDFNLASYKFKSTSYGVKSTSHEFISTCYEFRSTSLRIISSMKTQKNSLRISSFPKILSLK